MNRLALIALYPLLVLGLAFTALRYLFAVIGNPSKAAHIALMIDQTCNVDANGRVDESISYRAALARESGRRWGCVLCQLLDALVKDHCTRALERQP